MKRSVMAAVISATVYAALAASSASCTWMPEIREEGDACLTFRFLQAKADPAADTNRFILCVRQTDAEKPVYEGFYGDRPAELVVQSGSYTVSVLSGTFTEPAFDAPVYGDEQVVVARSGERLAVSFLCTQRNCGVRFRFSDRFRADYPGKLVLKQAEGQLSCSYDEQRTAWLFPGEVRICYNDGTAENVLFKRNLQAGEIRSFTLDATARETASSFSIRVDTTATRQEERITIGTEPSGDGLSASTAFSVEAFREADCAGDTVWVWGYVVGTILAEGTVDFTCDTMMADNNLALAASPDVRDAGSCIGIYLSKAAHKNVLSLAVPGNRAAVLHRKLYVQGKAYTYKKFPAITNICDYQLE